MWSWLRGQSGAEQQNTECQARRLGSEPRRLIKTKTVWYAPLRAWRAISSAEAQGSLGRARVLHRNTALTEQTSTE